MGTPVASSRDTDQVSGHDRPVQREDRRTNFLSRESLELHDEGSHAVAVSGDEDLFTLDESRLDRRFPVWEDTFGGHLQRLSLWRRDVVRSSPDVNLIFTPLLPCVVLVQTRESTVVTLVQLLGLDSLEVCLVNPLEDYFTRLLCSLQIRGKCNVEFAEVLLVQSDGGLLGLLEPELGKISMD